MTPPDFSFLENYQSSSLTMILSSFFIGIVIASAAMLYHQLFLGRIVRRIIQKNALTPETSLTIKELGYNPKNIFIKFALRKNSTFSKTVHRTEENKPRYFIPEEIKERSLNRFCKKGNNALLVIVFLIALLAAAYVLLTLIPWFTNALNQIF